MRFRLLGFHFLRKCCYFIGVRKHWSNQHFLTLCDLFVKFSQKSRRTFSFNPSRIGIVSFTATASPFPLCTISVILWCNSWSASRNPLEFASDSLIVFIIGCETAMSSTNWLNSTLTFCRFSSSWNNTWYHFLIHSLYLEPVGYHGTAAASFSCLVRWCPSCLESCTALLGDAESTFSLEIHWFLTNTTKQKAKRFTSNTLSQWTSWWWSWASCSELSRHCWTA